MPTPNPQSQEATGLATDAAGNPTIDPTKNVLDLVSAAIERQDDLRKAESLRLDQLLNARLDIFEARFRAFERELALIEDRRVEQKVDTKVAVDAALSAAEKAVKEQTVASEKSIIKSETSAAEQSKQQNATFTAALKGVTDTVGDLKERIGKLENIRQGQFVARTESRLDLNALIPILSLIAIVIFFFASR